jgi:nitrogenase delta subunit
MSSKVDDLFNYVQERCLWQFFSRTWDRQENIDGILATATDLLAGQAPKLDTPMDRLFYADAKIMVSDLRARLPWLNETPPAEIRELIEGLKARLEEIAIAGSKNRELSHHLY